MSALGVAAILLFLAQKKYWPTGKIFGKYTHVILLTVAIPCGNFC